MACSWAGLTGGSPAVRIASSGSATNSAAEAGLRNRLMMNSIKAFMSGSSHWGFAVSGEARTTLWLGRGPENGAITPSWGISAGGQGGAPIRGLGDVLGAAPGAPSLPERIETAGLGRQVFEVLEATGVS